MYTLVFGFSSDCSDVYSGRRPVDSNKTIFVKAFWMWLVNKRNLFWCLRNYRKDLRTLDNTYLGKEVYCWYFTETSWRVREVHLTLSSAIPNGNLVVHGLQNFQLIYQKSLTVIEMTYKPLLHVFGISCAIICFISSLFYAGILKLESKNSGVRGNSNRT